ncbi:hypothetical protein J5N97_015564 [Dioscorea zingiberensis]|uniref:Protein TIME FOR COFFEE n=1 Tax=Dioscorea zingiberensis TaxID=325984 RepID=A0A9D5CIL5_9LILI|nr:hypothetical protein J5N97_015564 [Dioscorea zingiberensis]
MERNREARRGSMAVMNGGLSRRRQRSSSLRDSPEEDGAMDMQETGRLRERGSKKDRDRERLSRNKRRRGDRMMHGSNREEGADTSDGSLEEDDDEEEEEAPMPVRLPPAPSSIPASSSLPPSNHLRKSFPAKVVRAPAVWKADEMIGVPIPRKARSGTAKRSHDCWASGGGSGGGGSGEASHRQPPPNSPARQSHASTGPMSPSSSNASVRKKIKTISGNKPQRPAKMAKSSSIQEIEIEVAEVLFGMTRQLQPKPEGHKPDSKETNGSGNDAKSRVSSPISNSQATGSSQPQASTMPNSNSNPAPVVVTAPKRKRPRPVKFEDESPTSPISSTAITSAPVASGAKTDSEVFVKTESSSPRTEKTTPSPINDNGGSLLDLGVPQVTSMSASTDRLQEPPKADGESVPDSVVRERIATIDENVAHVKQPAFADLDVNLDDDRGKKDDMGAEKQKEEKFSIDLMAPPPGKLSPERDTFPDPAAEPKPPKPVDSEIKLKIELSGRLEEKREGKPEASEMLHTVRKERILDLQIDLDKHGKEMSGSSKQQVQKQQMKPSGRMEAKPDSKSSGNASGSVPVPLPVGSWPSNVTNVPPFGYMGHVPSLPAVLPIDGSSGSTKTIQAPNFLSVQTRPSRCVTHCYIAQNIFYHQQIAKMNPFWPAAAGTMPLYGAKPYNLNAIPPSESTSIPSNSLQEFPVRNSGPLLDKGAHPSREKSSSTANPQAETAQRKQHPMQQLTAPASHGPAFIFSLNQQAAGAAPSVIRSAGPKSTPGASSAAAPSTAANFGVATTGSGGPPATVNFNYAMPVNEAHYLAILQNNAYPFQIPGAVGTPPAYRSGAPVQALPFFNGSFYSSQMLHPSQLQQQQQQPPPQQASHTQHGHQNQSTSSGSSSSQKHHSQQPQQRVAGGAAGGLPVPTAGLSSQSIPGSKSKQHLLSHQPQAETGCEDSPSTADSRVSQAGQKMVPGQNFPMPIHPPNFALMSPAAAALGGSATHSEKQSASQQSSLKVELTPSQAFAMSFTSLGGNAVTAGAPPGLDFSSLAQNHPIFQSLPEAARQGYQITAAASAQAAQHLKKSQQILEDRSGGESTSTTVGGEEERKVLAACKGTMNVPQQSLNFSRPDNNPSMPSILGNSVMENTPRTLTLIPANVNGGGISHRSSNSVLSSPPSTATVNAQHSQQQQQQQQQQQLIQLQKQQQQIIQLQKQQQHQQQHQHQLQHQLASRSKSLASSNSTSIYSERMPAGSTVTKFPPALAGFPQALIQGSGPSQSSQWKSSTKSATSAASSSHPVQSTVKTGIPQQQTRISQQSVPPQVHQTQISFGMNSAKMAAPAGQQLTGGNSMPSLSSAPTNIVIGSPQNSAASKTSAGGSPRASTNSKSGPPLPATSLPLQQQASAKISPSSSSRKSSPVSNRNVPSILGQPHISSSQSSTINKQQQHQTHQKQPYPQAQLFFSNPYIPVQSSQSNASNAAAVAAVAASYYQRRPTEQQPSQGPNLVAGSTGMLSLCPTTLSLVGAPVTVDPAKAVVAASSMKGMQQAGLLQHPGTASFPYIHGMPSVSIKPAEQKPAAGNDNLNASWQAERR